MPHMHNPATADNKPTPSSMERGNRFFHPTLIATRNDSPKDRSLSAASHGAKIVKGMTTHTIIPISKQPETSRTTTPTPGSWSASAALHALMNPIITVIPPGTAAAKKSITCPRPIPIRRGKHRSNPSKRSLTEPLPVRFRLRPRMINPAVKGVATNIVANGIGATIIIIKTKSVKAPTKRPKYCLNSAVPSDKACPTFNRGMSVKISSKSTWGS